MINPGLLEDPSERIQRTQESRSQLARIIILIVIQVVNPSAIKAGLREAAVEVGVEKNPSRQKGSRSHLKIQQLGLITGRKVEVQPVKRVKLTKRHCIND